MRRRYETLIERRRAETLTVDEHEELIRLGDDVERIDAHRAESLSRLALRRGVTLGKLLDDLGIAAPSGD